MTRRSVATFLIVLLSFQTALADSDKEHQVKAAFIYNFAKYCDWSSLGDAGAPFEVGVYETKAYGHALKDTLQGKSVFGHPIEVSEITDDTKVPECEILVVGDIGKDRLAHLVRACRNSGTLIVGESPNFAKLGGAIGFVIESNKVRFEVNLQTAKTDGVTISSKLLTLAKVVYP